MGVVMARDVLSGNLNGNGLPPWAKISVVGFLMLMIAYLLGALPGMKSPIDRIVEATTMLEEKVSTHERTTGVLLRINRLICRGMWRGNPEMQSECSKGD